MNTRSEVFRGNYTGYIFKIRKIYKAYNETRKL